MEIINPDKLCVNLFKGFGFTGVKVSIFPIGNWRRRYNSAALLHSLLSLFNFQILEDGQPLRICSLTQRQMHLYELLRITDRQ